MVEEKGQDLISRAHSAEADFYETLMKVIVSLVINIYTKHHNFKGITEF